VWKIKIFLTHHLKGSFWCCPSHREAKRKITCHTKWRWTHQKGALLYMHFNFLYIQHLKESTHELTLNSCLNTIDGLMHLLEVTYQDAWRRSYIFTIMKVLGVPYCTSRMLVLQAHGGRVVCLEHLPKGVDSSYHIQINVSVSRGIYSGISVHNIHKEEVLYIFSSYIQRGYQEIWIEGRCIRGPNV
jgi:hypothetical protein